MLGRSVHKKALDTSCMMQYLVYNEFRRKEPLNMHRRTFITEAARATLGAAGVTRLNSMLPPATLTTSVNMVSTSETAREDARHWFASSLFNLAVDLGHRLHTGRDIWRWVYAR